MYYINQRGQCDLIKKVALEPTLPLFLQIFSSSSFNSNLGLCVCVCVMCFTILHLIGILLVIIHTTKLYFIAFL